ncbi:hypothetical protein GJ744_000611 [Endocarpon pusillum]|uniref:Alcohol dehydrogenase-like N-terminal domain-containing protein n=1 Tax=Endocarpon pusillum TaxID=364733 RepID=A0A8H7E162_9EURO|nr:hypothetical protein GJ744_000611 [Endocarpon pusillum]
MATQKAVVIQAPKQVAVVTDRPLPKLRPGYLLVKVCAVALNPIDWKRIDLVGQAGALAGSDYAGVVEEIGSGYKCWNTINTAAVHLDCRKGE